MPRFGHGARLSLAATATAAASAYIYSIPDLPEGAAIVVTVTFMLLMLWTLTRMHLLLTTLAMYAVLYFGGIHSGEVLFSGFTSPTIWLLMGLTLLARAVSMMGLDSALMRKVFPSRPVTPLQILRAYWISNIVLTPLMPSGAGKTLVMLPSAKWLGSQVGGRMFDRALHLLLIYINGIAVKLFMMSAMALLVATIVNPYLENPLTWLRWFVMAVFPVGGLLVILYGLLRWLYFRADGQPRDVAGGGAAIHVGGLLSSFVDQNAAAVTPSQRLRSVIYLSLFLLAWVLEELHGIHPMALSFVAVFFLFAPGLGALTLPDVRKSIPWEVLINLGAAISLSYMLTTYGVADYLAGHASSLLAGRHALSQAALFLIASIGLRLFFVTNFAFLSVMMPVAMRFALDAGLNPLPFGLMLGFIGSVSVLLPAQSIPSMLVTQTGRLSRGELLRFGILFSLCSMAWILFTSLTYWPMLGEPLLR